MEIPKGQKLIKSNRADVVRKGTAAALSKKDELEKVGLLTSLRGVSLPMASAILMLLYPKYYGVIDIRVWVVLHQLKVVRTNPLGINFKLHKWHQYLLIIRQQATRLRAWPRDVERTLFFVHKAYQEGALYQNVQGAANKRDGVVKKEQH